MDFSSLRSHLLLLLLFCCVVFVVLFCCVVVVVVLLLFSFKLKITLKPLFLQINNENLIVVHCPNNHSQFTLVVSSAIMIGMKVWSSVQRLILTHLLFLYF